MQQTPIFNRYMRRPHTESPVLKGWLLYGGVIKQESGLCHPLPTTMSRWYQKKRFSDFWTIQNSVSSSNQAT